MSNDDWLTDELVAQCLVSMPTTWIDDGISVLIESVLQTVVASDDLVPRSRLEQVTTVAETYGFDPDDEPYIPLYRILPAPEGAESQLDEETLASIQRGVGQASRGEFATVDWNADAEGAESL